MATIFIRILLVYVLLLGTMRIMGKRQIGELQPSELVTTIMLSELAAQPIADSSIPFVYALLPIAALLSIEVLISFAVTRLPILKPIFDGKPSILILRGQLQSQELARVRISLEELLAQLRIAGVADLSEVDYAILEQNGQLSVIQRRSKSPPSAEELSLELDEPGLSHAIVVDGHISDFDLSLIKRDRKWLASRLRHHRASQEEVLLFSVNDAGEECLIKK